MINLEDPGDFNFQNRLFHDYPEAVFSIDLDGNFLSVNKALVDLAESTEQELLGASFLPFISEADAERVFQNFQNARQGEIQNFNARAVSTKGTEHDLNVTSVPIILNQKIIGIQVIAKDISEKTEIEKQLNLEREKYRDLFNLTPLPKWVYDVKTLEFLDVNDSAIELYGYSREEFASIKLSDLWLPEDAPIMEELFLKRKTEGHFSSSMIRHVKKSGEIIFLTTRSRAVHFKDRDSQLVSVIDVTEKLKAQEQLEASEQRFRALVQDGSDLIAILDESGNYIYVSPTSEAVLGIAADSFIGRNAFEFIHEDDRARVGDQLAMATPGTSIKVSPFRFLNADKEYRWVETIITNMVDHPAIGGIVTNSRDITDQVNYTREIESQNERLRQISWEQSHLLRDPLSRILGLTDLLMDEPDENVKKELFPLLKKSAEDLDMVIQNIIKKADFN